MAQKVLNGTGLKVNKKKKNTHWWLICLLLAYCYLQSKNPDLVDPVIFFSLHFTLVAQGHLTRHLLRIHLLREFVSFLCVSENKFAISFLFHTKGLECVYIQFPIQLMCPCVLRRRSSGRSDHSLSLGSSAHVTEVTLASHPTPFFTLQADGKQRDAKV